MDTQPERATDSLWRAAIESLPCGVVMTDERGQIVLVNDAIHQIFGYRSDDLLGQGIEVLVPQRFREPHRHARVGFAAGAAHRPMGAGRDLLGLRKDGSELPVEIGLKRIKSESGNFVIASIVDITERRRMEMQHQELEAQLRHAQKFEALGALAGGIAHDFNNILGAIIGFAELAQTSVSSEQGHDDLSQVLIAADRGKQLVRRILAFSRRQPLERRVMAIEQSVMEIVRLLRSTLPPTIKLQWDIKSDLPRVLADPTAIHQVLMNLTTNAWHAMPQGGTLEIAVEVQPLGEEVARTNPELRRGNYLVLSTRDTGSGMDAEVLHRAFEPFFTTKPMGTGTGLGLAVVRGIVTEHGGAVSIGSEVGRGTTVTCYFPALEGEASAQASAPAEIPVGHHEHVLFVDDQAALAIVGERHLTALGYRVTVATNGNDALEMIISQPSSFDVVISDYLMPGLDGLELARAIKGIRADLPVMLVTGAAKDLSDTTVAEAGVRAVLPKPATMSEIGFAVHQALQR